LDRGALGSPGGRLWIAWPAPLDRLTGAFECTEIDPAVEKLILQYRNESLALAAVALQRLSRLRKTRVSEKQIFQQASRLREKHAYKITCRLVYARRSFF
jgi:hypothetical protein